MGDWFTTERADEDTYILSEYRHREETHSYLLCGRERALLIDTGLGVADISAAVRALTPLPVSVVLHLRLRRFQPAPVSGAAIRRRSTGFSYRGHRPHNFLTKGH